MAGRAKGCQPHKGGEPEDTAGPAYGSSPHLWGTPNHPINHMMLYRFIPTPVGNTSRYASPHRHIPVHPHTCGEHSSLFIPEPGRGVPPIGSGLVYYRGSANPLNLPVCHPGAGESTATPSTILHMQKRLRGLSPPRGPIGRADERGAPNWQERAQKPRQPALLPASAESRH